MSDVLERIGAYKRDEIAKAKRERPLAKLRAEAERAAPPRGFVAALDAAISRGRPALIAEIKKASPSRGLIRADFDPAALARAYAAGGASCLSVLTDTPSFEGAPEHLAAARAATPLPVLRKDFLYDHYQVAESRALGADCILIIMAAVDDKTARELFSAAIHWNMDALLEVHDERELERALAIGSRLIGINNRDLRTLGVDLGTTALLRPLIPAGVVVVSESGFERRDQVEAAARLGVDAILVGTSLMGSADPAAKLKELRGIS